MAVEDPPYLTTRLNINNNPSSFDNIKTKTSTQHLIVENDDDEEEDEKISHSYQVEENEEEEEEYGANNSDFESTDLVLSASEDGGLQELDKVTTFGNVCVNNSTDVHLGNKTYFQGPVTIKQIMYTSAAELPKDVQSSLAGLNGFANPKVYLTEQGSVVNGVRELGDKIHNNGNLCTDNENKNHHSESRIPITIRISDTKTPSPLLKDGKNR